MPHVLTNPCYVYSVTIWDSIDAHPHIFKFFSKICKKFIFQLEECPQTKKHHYQCYVNLKVKKRQSEMCKMFNCEGFTGSDISVASENGKIRLQQYAMKTESRLDGPWADKPIYLGQDLIQKLRPWQQEVADLIDTTPDKRTIYWYYDKIGGRGKTQLAKYLCFHKPKECTYLSVGKAADLLNFVYKKQGMKLYFIDIARTIPNGIMNEIYMAIESVKNGFFLNTKYETGMAMFACPHVVVYSNHLPKGSALSYDRLEIKDLEFISPRL